MSEQNFMSYGDAETIFTDVQTRKFSTGNVSTIQSTLTASKAYNQNDPFIYNGQLYKADSAIAQGGTITIGTNASATTIEELINLHSSSSGGHTILDSSGTAMTQRGKLQFVGADVVDDSGNDKTVVTMPTPDYVDEQYNNTTTYSKGMTCISGNKRYRYINSTASSGHQPPNATYWEVLSVASEIDENTKFHVGDTYILDQPQYGRGYCYKNMPTLYNSKTANLFVELPKEMDASITGATLSLVRGENTSDASALIFSGGGYYGALKGATAHSVSHCSVVLVTPKMIQINATISSIEAISVDYTAPSLTTKMISGFARFNMAKKVSITFN